MAAVVKKTFPYGNHTVSIETGEIAKQATGAVLVSMDETVVLVTAVCSKEPLTGADFLPLVVDYEERMYAAGQFPKGFVKREGRPSMREIVISRLIDRAIRPLFPSHFRHEIQVIATVLSINPEVETDIVAMIGASAAIALAGLPFGGPLAAARIGYRDGRFMLNPTQSQLGESQLNLVVAGTEHAVLMVESEANVLPESVMLDAIWHGHDAMQRAIQTINELVAEAGKTRWEVEAPVVGEALEQALKEFASEDIQRVYQIADKQLRQTELKQLRQRVHEQFLFPEGVSPVGPEPPPLTAAQVDRAFAHLQHQLVRERILAGGSRIDGRDTRTVRPISIKLGLLPRTHGSALFTRGETQALVVSTLGSEPDSQVVENLMTSTRERFLLHYNFPPYCTGETGRLAGPRRREIGHGNLARRGLQAVMPTQTEFPYVIRVVSEITEANGSTSMATVCGTSLSLMDAGVPIKTAVAGIAMGLVMEENKFAILSDIMGDEDHLGDMDFKVVGPAEGLTALQMDIKIEGITRFLMERALEQAKEGRLHILQKMREAIDRPRAQLAAHAPVLKTIKIDPEKIRDVIGKGGVVIRGLTEETGATIDVKDDGTIQIAAPTALSAAAAEDRIQQLTGSVEIGARYSGKVVRLMDFGAFVNLIPGKDGFLHISQISDGRIDKITDVLHEGQIADVKVVEIDRQGRVRLTMKE